VETAHSRAIPTLHHRQHSDTHLQWVRQMMDKISNAKKMDVAFAAPLTSGVKSQQYCDYDHSTILLQVRPWLSGIVVTMTVSFKSIFQLTIQNSIHKMLSSIYYFKFIKKA
jgi:hypothetical protein